VIFPELFGFRLPYIFRIPPIVYQGSQYLHAVAFDKYVAWRMQSLHPDIFVAFSRYGLNSFCVCKDRGITTVVERGSAHTVVRERILNEEYARLGATDQRNQLDIKVVERELLEYEKADYISVPSGFATDSFVDMGVPREKIIRTPYGVDLERFQPDPNGHQERFTVLTVGNLGIEKGTGYLLDSITLLGRRDIKLKMAGSLDTYIKNKLRTFRQPWTFAGHIHQQNLASLYNSASVYCLLSVQEGMSMTVLEAMACGIPVVASINTGAADIITDGVDGFIVPIRDLEATAEKLLLLYKNPDICVEMGRCARKRVAECAWDNYGNIVSKEYKRICKDSLVVSTVVKSRHNHLS